MKLTSKIKTTFNDELLKLLGSICDTIRIPSNQRKMVLVQQLLKKYKVRYSPLGGATNRLVLLIDGYVYKSALDRQGFKDNLMEYALSKELQPYVTRSYESNGYILVAEVVKTMTKEDFNLRRTDILKVLECLCSDYLLGDVGYIPENFTNWGIRDDGSVVILDYAYCHRGTENLFICEECGNGILRYDSTFSYLRCSNATGGCQKKYSYIDRKVRQGDAVDIDMIKEVQHDSITLPQGVSFREVTEDGGVLQNTNTIVIKTKQEYLRYLKEVNNKMMFADYTDQTKMLDLLTQKAAAKTAEEKARIQREISDIEIESPDEEETKYILDLEDDIPELLEEDDKIHYDIGDINVDDVDYDPNAVIDECYSLDKLVSMANNPKLSSIASDTSHESDVTNHNTEDDDPFTRLFDKAAGLPLPTPDMDEDEAENTPTKVEYVAETDITEPTDNQIDESVNHNMTKDVVIEAENSQNDVIDDSTEEIDDGEAEDVVLTLNGEPV